MPAVRTARLQDRALRHAALALTLAILLLAPPAVWAQRPGGGGQRPATPVVVATVERSQDAPSASYTGLIAPQQTAELSVNVAGRVTEVRKKAGDFVRRGEVLAQLENPSLELDLGVVQAQVKEAQAALAQQRLKQTRAEDLYKQNLASKEVFENESAALALVQARLATARATEKRLRDQLAMMTVRAPLGGQVVRASLSVGQWVTSSTTIYEIYNYERFEVEVGVPGRYVTSLPPHAAVKVSVPEVGLSLQGEVLSVVRHVDAASGKFQVRVGLDNTARMPLSGLMASVEVPLGRAELLVTVPRDAVVRTGDRTHVVVVRDDAAQVVPVALRGNLGDRVIVDGTGLNPGEPVVVRGNERLSSGTAVRVTGELNGNAASAAGTGTTGEARAN